MTGEGAAAALLDIAATPSLAPDIDLSPDARARLAEALAALEQAKARLDRLLNGG